MYKKYFSSHWFYFIIFTVISILYITNGYASIATGDDWALRSMLVEKGIYGTLIMSYPLSYVMSHLYDYFPTFQWYSVLLTLVMGINYYFISLYIAKKDSYIQKIILFILALLWMTFLWFNMSITVLTMTTMLIAAGLIQKNLLMSFVVIFIASLLRTDNMLMFMPYYFVSFFILREQLLIKKKEILGFTVLVLLVAASLFIQKQDKPYSEWMAFNKARSAISDTGLMNVEKDYFSPAEFFCTQVAWFQDPELLSTEKMLATTPSFIDIGLHRLPHVRFIAFLQTYKYKYWIWLLLVVSLLVMLINIKNRKSISILLLFLGIFLLMVFRDVDRVTMPLFMLWSYVLFESLKAYQKINILFLFLVTSLFFYYISEQLGYRYFKEITSAQKEARQLIKSSNKICEVSINYPTNSNAELGTIFLYNYIFHEDIWLKINDNEILPTGWLSRHPFFYKAHQMSDAYTTRKYDTYYDYLIADHTAFIGGKELLDYEGFNVYLLGTYDKLHLKDKPHCKHKTFIVSESEHFSLSQIRVDCNTTSKP